MGEGFDFSSLMGMFGGGGGAGANFGAGLEQPQLTGMFGGTPQTPGGNLMSGSLQTMPTMQNFDAGTLPGGFQAPGSFGMSGYGQGASMPNLGGLAGLGGGQKQQQPQAMPMQMGGGGGGGGGGNMRGLFSALMQSPQLRQVNPTLGLLGNAMGG